MKLTSFQFDHEGKIPSKYTCDGENIIPPLTISDVPEGTVSLALIMSDPDIPDFVKEKFNIDEWVHWVVYNMPADTDSIQEGQQPAGEGGQRTEGEQADYFGPCPPDREHRYFFELYALDTNLQFDQTPTKYDVIAAMKDHVLEQATLIGRYEREGS